MPTESAHGFQIAKMCEAFARAGLDVELWHPRRHQPSRLRGHDVFGYYGIDPSFRTRALPNLDVLRWSDRPGLRWTSALFPMQQWGWAQATAGRAARSPSAIWYTRTAEIADALTRRGLETVCELHTLLGEARTITLRRALRRPSFLRISAVTTALAEEVAHACEVEPSRIRVLPDAVDLGAFEDLPDRDTARARLGLPTDRAIVGYLGRFTTLGQEKGLSVVIDAAALVRDPRPLFLFVGGPMQGVPAYMERAHARGVSDRDLRFVDRVGNADVPTWLAALDVALMPFQNRPHFAIAMSPLKMFEYMAAGLPIVATDLPSVRDVLRHGENAWLAAPDDPSDLARGITAMLADRRLATALGERARLDVAAHTWAARAHAALDGLEVST